MQWTLRITAIAIASILFVNSNAIAQDKEGSEKAKESESTASDEILSLADGKILLARPKAWKSMPPKSQMIEHEFKAPAEGDKPARVTIMSAGGSLEANIDRWIGQFDGAKKADAKIETKQIADTKITTVDLTGTFKESMGGPFAPNAGTKKMENYRLLGAILQIKDGSMTFVKLTGPAETVKELNDGWVNMLKDLKNK